MDGHLLVHSGKKVGSEERQEEEEEEKKKNGAGEEDGTNCLKKTSHRKRINLTHREKLQAGGEFKKK